MKSLIVFLSLAFVLSACNSKNYLDYKDENKAITEAIKQLNKKPNDEKALKAVPVLYQNLQSSSLAKINSYKNSREISRWDNIINEYTKLQNAYSLIMGNNAAFKAVTPTSYATELLDARESGAEEYYALGQTYLNKNSRSDAKLAYNYFMRANSILPDYKDSKLKAQQSFTSAIVNVVINRLQDNSFFYNSGYGSSSLNYTNQYFQDRLIRDLQYNSESKYAARFFTEYDARREGINPDIFIDLTLRNMRMPNPRNYTQRYNRSARIQVGTDTSGNAIYRNVNAIVNITRRDMDADVNLDMNISDAKTGKTMRSRSFRDSYSWYEEYGSYSGDSRALTSSDWDAINNSRSYYNQPRIEDVMDELYRRIYPQVKSAIENEVEW